MHISGTFCFVLTEALSVLLLGSFIIQQSCLAIWDYTLQCKGIVLLWHHAIRNSCFSLVPVYKLSPCFCSRRRKRPLLLFVKCKDPSSTALIQLDWFCNSWHVQITKASPFLTTPPPRLPTLEPLGCLKPYAYTSTLPYYIA